MLAAAVLALVSAVAVSLVEAEKAGAAEQITNDGSTALTCLVFLTQYDGNTDREAALPYLPLKDDGRRIRIERTNGAAPTWVTVKEVGPWNTNDAYWLRSAERVWKGLPRCTSEAEAAFYDLYNGGRDEFRREVVNPASVEVTPAVARDLGLDRHRGAWVHVRFPWVRQ